MKKLIFCCLLASICLLNFSCRKGEGDPRFTLHTRKARLCGEWTLKSMLEEIHYTTRDSGNFSPNNSSYLQTRSVKSQNLEDRTSYFSASNTTEVFWAGQFECKYEFNKDGTFKIVEITTDYSDVHANPDFKNSSDNTFEWTGTWSFVGGQGDAFKNKERIVMNFLHSDYNETYTSFNGDVQVIREIQEFGDGENTEIWTLNTLDKDRLILKRSEFTSYRRSVGTPSSPLRSIQGNVSDGTISYTFFQ